MEPSAFVYGVEGPSRARRFAAALAAAGNAARSAQRIAGHWHAAIPRELDWGQPDGARSETWATRNARWAAQPDLFRAAGKIAKVHQVAANSIALCCRGAWPR